MKNSLFSPNEKNIGGRKQINELVYNHHFSLLRIKPITNSFPFQIVKKPKSKKSNNLNERFEFNGVYHSFKKVVEMKKGYIDNKEPITMEMKASLQKKTGKLDKFIKSEHENNMISQRVRIARFSKTVEKKKNQMDPVTNPIYEVVVVPKKKKAGTLDFMFNPTLNQRKIIKPSSIQVKSK